MYKKLRKVLLVFLAAIAVVCGTLFAVACDSVDININTGNNNGGEQQNPGGEQQNPGGEQQNPGGEQQNPGGEQQNPGGEQQNPGGSEGESYDTPDGGTDYWYVGSNDLWAHHEGDPYAVSETGTYYIPVQFSVTTVTEEDEAGVEHTVTSTKIYAHVIEFTASESGEHSYVFKWDAQVYSLTYLNSNEEVNEQDDAVLNNDSYGQLIFSLSEGDTVIVILGYNYDYWENPLSEGDEIGYVLTIESGEPITEGSLYRPFEIEEAEGTHSAPVGFTKAYFALPTNSNSYTYEVTFGDGVNVYSMISGLNAIPEKLSSGDQITPLEYYQSYIYATASEGTQIEFTLTNVVRSGSKERPIDLSKGQVVSYHFYDTLDVWYAFKAEDSQYYHIVVSGTYIGIYNEIPESDDVFPSYEIFSDSRRDVYLEAGTYYIQLVSSWGNDTSLKISDVSSSAGSILNPQELSLGESSADFTNDTALYFTYTAAYDGTLNYVYDEDVYGVYIYLYSDENYSESLGGPYSDSFKYAVSAGDVLYFCIEAPYLGKSLNIVLQLKLPAPQNVYVNNKVLHWNAVGGAIGYAIYDGSAATAIATVDKNTTSYNLSGLSAGAHTLRVVARGDSDLYLTSDKSTGASYTVSADLATPTGLEYKDGVLSWDEVTGAPGYRVGVNQQNIGSATYVTTNSVTVGALGITKSGPYTFYVMAYNNGNSYLTNSDWASLTATVKIACDFEVGETLAVVSGDTKTIYLEVGTYTVILDGEHKNSIRVADDNGELTSEQATAKGVIIECEWAYKTSAVTSTAVPVVVETAGEYKFKFYDVSEHGYGCTIKVEEGTENVIDAPGAYIITLGEPKAVTLGVNGVNFTFTTDAGGWYSLELSDVGASSYSVKVNNGQVMFDVGTGRLVDMLDSDFGQTSGLFEATGETEYTITFAGSGTLNVTITYHHPGDILLSVVEENGATASGFLATSPSILDLDEESDKLDSMGKLLFNGLVGGDDYTIVIVSAMNKSSQFILVYNGVTYKSYSSLTREGYYCVTFTAEAGVDEGYFYSISVEDNVTVYVLRLVNYVEGDKPTGPAVGDKIQITPGQGFLTGYGGTITSKTFVTVDFGSNFIAGEDYVLGIGDSPEEFAWAGYDYYLVLSDDSEIKFAYPAGDTSHFEAAFTADGNDVKIYATKFTFKNIDPAPVYLEVLVSPTDAKPHVCQSECSECGGCLNTECQEPDCLEKCSCNNGDDEIDGVIVWEQAEVALNSGNWYMKTYTGVHLEKGSYTVKIAGNKTDITVKIKEGDSDPVEILTEGTTATFEIDHESDYTILVLDPGWPGTDQTFSIAIYAPVSACWEQAEVVLNSGNWYMQTYPGAAHLEAGNYTVKIAGNKTNITVKIKEGDSDPVEILTEGTTATFEIDHESDYTILVLDPGWPGTDQTFSIAIYKA